MNFSFILLLLVGIQAQAEDQNLDFVIQYENDVNTAITSSDQSVDLLDVEKVTDENPKQTKALIDRVAPSRTLYKKASSSSGEGIFQCKSCGEDNFIAGGFGAGINLRTGSYVQRGVSATGMIMVSPEVLADNGDTPLAPMSAELVFNAANIGQGIKSSVGTVLSAFIHPAALYSPLLEKNGDVENGIDFLIGVSARARPEFNINSNEGFSINGALMPETGLYANSEKVSLMLTGSVQIGGEGCMVKVPGVSDNFLFHTRAISYGGIARLYIGNRFAMNAIYAFYPESNADSKQKVTVPGKVQQVESTKRVSGGYFRIMALLNLSDKLSVSGSCDITKFSTLTYADYTRRNWDRTIVRVGLIRRFGVN